MEGDQSYGFGRGVQSPVVACFNVKYSPNLGDGLLSECLEAALVDFGSDPKTRSIDLAGRTVYGDVMSFRDSALKFLDRLPGPARRLVVRAPLAIKVTVSWGPHYRRELTGADAVVIGGGNVISDLDLNFPVKLGRAISEAARRDLPIVFYACGMAPGWSETGLRMFRTSFADSHVKGVFLRDTDSAAMWNELLAPHVGHRAQVARDPGLLASEVYTHEPDREKIHRRPVVGLGVMSHIAVRYHSDNLLEQERLDRWYVDVAKGMIAAGYQVRVFTNGSPEDRAYLARLAAEMSSLGGEGDLIFLEQRTPKELCAHISAFDVMIAFRMHAVIAAYSYGVPAIALAWDKKLQSFMESVWREDWLLDVATVSPQDGVEAAIRTHREGIDPIERATVVAEARADVGRLSQVLGRGLAGQ